MDFKGFMKGPILFDRKKMLYQIVPHKVASKSNYNFDVIAENCLIL